MALEECKFEHVPDDMSVELDDITKGPWTTLYIENTFNMDRDQIRRQERWAAFGGSQLGTGRPHAGLLREADKEILEVISEDITESPPSVPLGTFDSRKCRVLFSARSSSTLPWRIHQRCLCTPR